MQTNSRWSGPPVREVVWKAVQRFTDGDVDVEFAIKDIEQVALEMYPDFKVSNVGPEIAAGCVNSASRHHYSPDIDRYWKVGYGVYRLYETDQLYESNQPVGLDGVLEKINEIAKASAGDNYIYRGESKCHEKVCSSLYREYPHTEGVYFDIDSLQDVILEEAKTYIGQTDDIDETDNIGLLTQIQHFGGKTNLIDFTRDYLIALFFACDGSHEEDGRVILLKEESDDYTIEEPGRTINRVESQKSVFVASPTGFVEPDSVVTIPADLKFFILDYLKKHHRISIATIYNDLHGFIRRSAYIEFLKGLTNQGKVDEAKTIKKKNEYYKNAIRHYTEAIKLKPDFAGAYNNRGAVYFSMGDFAAAVEDFNKAIDLDAEFTEAYNGRGLVYISMGDFEAAIEDYSRAIDLSPEDAKAYSNRGLTYRDIGDFAAAIEDLNKAIDLDAEFTEAYNGRGLVYLSTGDFDAALEEFSKAIDLDAEDASVYGNRGLAYLITGDFAAAIQDYSKAIGLDAKNARFYNNRGLTYAGKSDFAAAIEDYNKAIDLDAEDASVYGNRGAVYFSIGDFAAAIEDYNKAIDLDAEDARFYSNRGVTYRNIGDFAAAIEDYSKAIGLDPEFTEAYNGRGLIYLSMGDFDAAIEDYSRAIDLSPEDAKAYSNRGEAWLHLKEWQKAKADLTTAKEMGCDIVESFQNDYESVEAFEAKLGVQVPEDIAALLQRK